MNREILFRGKHIHIMDSNEHLNGTWVHGYLSDKNYIYDKSLDGEFLVDENTICQYTGLTDKNGKKIWEGDIIKYHFGEVYAPVKFGEYQSCFDSTSTSHVGFYVDWDETVTRKVTLDTGAPVFEKVTLTPNPVDCGKTFVISVKVTD